MIEEYRVLHDDGEEAFDVPESGDVYARLFRLDRVTIRQGATDLDVTLVEVLRAERP